MLSLEEESSICLFKYGKEIGFIRQLILDGNWDDLENFFDSAQLRDKIDYNQIAFQIGRQKYLELLESQQLDKNYVVEALKSMESICTKEAYNGLCYLLTLKQLNDHPDFAQWTVQRGRMECFEAVKNILQSVFGQQEKRRTPSNRLLKLLKDSVGFQYFMAKQTGSMATLKFDPINQSSEASLLKDLTNIDTQQKFYKNNLNEVKISFYNRSQRNNAVNSSSNTHRFNSMMHSIDHMDENEVQEDIDIEDNDEGDLDNFAQSMPAQYTVQSN